MSGSHQQPNESTSADSKATSAADVFQWMLAKSEEAAAVAIGLTVLNVNRLQVYRRDLAKAFDQRTQNPDHKSAKKASQTTQAGGSA